MNKEFVPYEQALALKELGFNEPCFGMYQKNKKIWHCAKNNWITNFQIEPDSETLNLHIKEYPENVSLINGTYFLHSCANFTSPLYQQAFRWFREKHNLRSFIDTRVYDVDSPNQWVYDFQIKMGNGVDTQPFYSGDFDTYEEAELACLKKLIQIVKNK